MPLKLKLSKKTVFLEFLAGDFWRVNVKLRNDTLGSCSVFYALSNDMLLDLIR